MVVLDSTFLVAIQRNEAAANRLWAELENLSEPLRVPAAAWVEYLSYFGPASVALATRELEANSVFEPFEREHADEAVILQSERRRAGRALGWHDCQIAATARLRREPLVSADEGFADIPGVTVLNWNS